MIMVSGRPGPLAPFPTPTDDGTIQVGSSPSIFPMLRPARCAEDAHSLVRVTIVEESHEFTANHSTCR